MHTFFIAPFNMGDTLGVIGQTITKHLESKGLKVGYFKPFNLTATNQNTTFSRDYIENKLCNNELDVLLEDVVKSYQQIAQGNDVIIIEGLDTNLPVSYVMALNTAVARSFNADVILASSTNHNKTTEQLIRSTDIQAHSFNDKAIGSLYLTDNIQTLAQQLKQESSRLFHDQFKIIGYISTGKTDIELLDIDYLYQRTQLDQEPRLSPPVFRYQLVKRAQEANKRIVLPEGDEPRTIHAAIICQQRKIARCVLLAKPEDVHNTAKSLGLSVPSDLEIIDPTSIQQHYVEPMVELRKAKGMTPELATKSLEDTVVLGTMMLATDDVDGLVSGAVHTTASTVRPALQLIKTAPHYNLVSSVFFMLLPDQVLVYGDCAINPAPTAQELADIAIQSAESATAFGITPRVAMISYSTGESGTGEAVEKVKEATRLAKEKRPDLLIDGPLQYDASTVESVAKQKAPNSQVAGRATVFIFPDLNTGNTTYKAVQRSAQVISVGPMLQGLRKPVNDLSRGALVEDIVFTIALTAIQAANAH